MDNLAVLLIDLERYDEAEKLYAETLELAGRQAPDASQVSPPVRIPRNRPGGGPILIEAVVADVQPALALRPNPGEKQPEGCVRARERNAKRCLCPSRAEYSTTIGPSLGPTEIDKRF